MPFIYDFNESKDQIHNVEVSPKGWTHPVVVEYTVAQAHKYDPMVSVIWRIKGTTHCFTIGEQRLNHLSHGNYKEHFQQALEGFAIDYNSWFTDPMFDGCEWRNEYEQQFGKLIVRDQDKKGKS